MPGLTGTVTQHYGANSGELSLATASIGAEVSQTVGKNGGVFAVAPSVGGEGSIERWLYGPIDESDTGGREQAIMRTTYDVELFRGGHTAWREQFTNLVMTAGLNKLLDAAFKTGLASPAWAIGLVDGSPAPAFEIGDTSASHAGWVENEEYSEGTRPAFDPGTISGGSVDNANSRAVFHITSACTVAGFFLIDENTIGGGTGVLYGAGAFGGGARDVEDGDILRVATTIEAA